MTPQQRGREFEETIAREFGAKPSLASGALWFDKLDGSGSGFKLSSKYTEKNSFSISKSLIDEAVKATQGMGSDGSIPIWVIRLQEPQYDMVMIRKNDFLQLLEEPTIVDVKKKPKKPNKAPILMRETVDE